MFIGSPADARLAQRAGIAAAAACAIAIIATPDLAFSAASPAPARSTTMRMDEPMAGEMKKEGTKKGDVKQHAEQWEKEMKVKMEEEEKARHEGSARR
jgi:hypothetical protein